MLLWLVKAWARGAASKGFGVGRCPERPCSEDAEECRERCGEGSALPAGDETEERLVGTGEPATLVCAPRAMGRLFQGGPSWPDTISSAGVKKRLPEGQGWGGASERDLLCKKEVPGAFSSAG